MLVSQLHHVLAVIAKRLTPVRLDDDRAIGAIRLLKSRVTVEPVSAGLRDRKAIGEGFTRRDARITQSGHSVHLVRQYQSVPVHRGRLIEVVGDMNGDVLAFAKAQYRPRRCTVVANALLAEVAGVDGHLVDSKPVLTGPAQRRQQCQRREQCSTRHRCPPSCRPDSARAHCRQIPGGRRVRTSRPARLPAPAPAAGCWHDRAPYCAHRPCPSSSTRD